MILELYEISWLIHLAIELPVICLSVLAILPSLANATIPNFYYKGSGDLHTYKTHVLPTELCPQHLLLDIY